MSSSSSAIPAAYLMDSLVATRSVAELVPDPGTSTLGQSVEPQSNYMEQLTLDELKCLMHRVSGPRSSHHYDDVLTPPVCWPDIVIPEGTTDVIAIENHFTKSRYRNYYRKVVTGDGTPEKTVDSEMEYYDAYVKRPNGLMDLRMDQCMDKLSLHLTEQAYQTLVQLGSYIGIEVNGNVLYSIPFAWLELTGISVSQNTGDSSGCVVDLLHWFCTGPLPTVIHGDVRVYIPVESATLLEGCHVLVHYSAARMNFPKPGKDTYNCYTSPVTTLAHQVVRGATGQTVKVPYPGCFTHLHTYIVVNAGSLERVDIPDEVTVEIPMLTSGYKQVDLIAAATMVGKDSDRRLYKIDWTRVVSCHAHGDDKSCHLVENNTKIGLCMYNFRDVNFTIKFATEATRNIDIFHVRGNLAIASFSMIPFIGTMGHRFSY